MTLALDAKETQSAPTRRENRALHVCSRMGLPVLLVVTGLLYLWNLAASGWPNSMAVQLLAPACAAAE